MDNPVGTVVEGKVKSIAKFGAFIALPDGRTGLVHISEVANAYVDDIARFLTVGQDVTVKILSADANGRLSLSIKQAQAPQDRRVPDKRGSSERRSGSDRRAADQPKTAEAGFEAKLKAFLSESDSKIAGIRADHRTRSRKR